MRHIKGLEITVHGNNYERQAKNNDDRIYSSNISIHLSHIHTVPDLTKFKKLSSLHIASYADPIVFSLSSVKNLKSLNDIYLRNVIVTDEVLELPSRLFCLSLYDIQSAVTVSDIVNALPPLIHRLTLSNIICAALEKQYLPERLYQLRRLTNITIENMQIDASIFYDSDVYLPYVTKDKGALMSNLKCIEMSNTGLTSIPPAFFLMKKLDSLYLSRNMIEQIPEGLLTMKNLEYLTVSYNRITGPIPQEITRLKYLSSLDLCHNKMTGPIPAELWSMKWLDKLSLMNNQLEGEVSTDIVGNRKYEWVYLADNAGLYGTIDTSRIHINHLLVIRGTGITLI